MRSAAHVQGHPVHPILVGFPVAYLLGSVGIDLWARASNRPSWHRTATHLNALGILSALAAAVPGAIDYVFTVPPRSSARERATRHALSNLSAVGLFALARLGRNHGEDRPAPWALAAELAGSALLGVGGWLGGTLVYRNQIGVDRRYADAGRSRIEAAAPGTSTIDAGPVDELQPDQMKLLRSGDRRIALARTADGFVAFDDRCTHRGGPLSDGALVCGTVQCPWHGSQFDASTGQVRRGPAETPVATYRVSVRGDRVFVEV